MKGKMRLCIMAAESQWENGRIREEAEKRKHIVNICAPKELLHSYPECTHLLVRAIAGQLNAARAVAWKAKQAGIKVVDGKMASRQGGTNKLAVHKALKKCGFFVPQTLPFTEKNIPKIKKFPGEEVVIKDTRGKRGKGVSKCRRDKLETVLFSLGPKRKYLAQEFVPILKELRVLVIGDKPLGAFSKTSEDWRHNVALGAKPKKEKLTPDVAALAVNASQIVKTEIAGVDIAVTPKGYFVIEVNRSPQFRGFETATKKNVAKEIVKYLEGK